MYFRRHTPSHSAGCCWS